MCVNQVATVRSGCLHCRVAQTNVGAPARRGETSWEDESCEEFGQAPGEPLSRCVVAGWWTCAAFDGQDAVAGHWGRNMDWTHWKEPQICSGIFELICTSGEESQTGWCQGVAEEAPQVEETHFSAAGGTARGRATGVKSVDMQSWAIRICMHCMRARAQHASWTAGIWVAMAFMCLAEPNACAGLVFFLKFHAWEASDHGTGSVSRGAILFYMFVGHSCSQIFHSQEHTSNYVEDWSTVSWYV